MCSHLCLEVVAAVSGEQGGRDVQSTGGTLSRAMEEQLLHFSAGRNSQQTKEWEKPSRVIPLKSCLGPKPQMSFWSFSWVEGLKSLCSPADALFQLSVGAHLSTPFLQIFPPGESLQCQSIYKQIFL